MATDDELQEQRMVWTLETGLPTVTHPIQCGNCKHRTPGDGFPRCDAFDKIPMDILTNRFNHTKPYPGDGGVRFEPTS